MRNAAAADRAAAGEARGYIGNASKRARFDEFIKGILSVSVFHAADIWLPFAENGGLEEDEAPRLFMSDSVTQVSLKFFRGVAR